MLKKVFACSKFRKKFLRTITITITRNAIKKYYIKNSKNLMFIKNKI